MRTAGQFLQDSPFVDAQLNIPPTEMYCIGGVLTTNGSVPGKITAHFTNASATYYAFAEESLLHRLGTVPNYQEQFGTAALVPGPSGVANTSDPLNLVGMPPTQKSALATLTGGPNGYVPKGIQLNYIDVLYQIGTNPLVTNTIGIQTYQILNNSAVVKTNLLALAANGLQTAVQTNPYVTRINISNPSFITISDTFLNISLVATSSASAPVFDLLGFVLGVSFNFN